MLLELESFSIETALDAATELRRVLAARTHRRKVMGQEGVVRPEGTELGRQTLQPTATG